MPERRENCPLDLRPIGIFDSGLGGLTAYAVLRRELPGEHLIFFGDSGRAPYGSRPPEQLLEMGRQNLRLLREHGVKAVLAACGTISSNALDTLMAEVPELPMRGVIRDAAARAAAETKNGHVGVIATQATVNAGAYAKALRELAPGTEVLSLACPEFVPAIEAGRFHPEDPEARAMVERALAPLQGTGIDTLILGCTHYPLLRPLIAAAMGPGVALVDSGREAALGLAGQLRELGLLASRETGESTFLVSGDGTLFARCAQAFLGRDIAPQVREVPPLPL